MRFNGRVIHPDDDTHEAEHESGHRPMQVAEAPVPDAEWENLALADVAADLTQQADQLARTYPAVRPNPQDWAAVARPAADRRRKRRMRLSAAAAAAALLLVCLGGGWLLGVAPSKGRAAADATDARPATAQANPARSPAPADPRSKQLSNASLPEAPAEEADHRPLAMAARVPDPASPAATPPPAPTAEDISLDLIRRLDPAAREAVFDLEAQRRVKARVGL